MKDFILEKGEYQVRWDKDTSSSSTAVVCRRKKFLGIIPYFSICYKGNSYYNFRLDRWLPDEMEEAFEDTFKEYLRYKEAWKNVK